PDDGPTDVLAVRGGCRQHQRSAGKGTDDEGFDSLHNSLAFCVDNNGRQQSATAFRRRESFPLFCGAYTRRQLSHGPSVSMEAARRIAGDQRRRTTISQKDAPAAVRWVTRCSSMVRRASVSCRRGVTAADCSIASRSPCTSASKPGN